MAKSKRSYSWLIVLVILVLGGAGYGTFRYIKSRDTALAVQTEKVSRRNLTEIVVATGKVQPVLQVVINPEVSGEIIELSVVEGQLVKKGDLLLKIRPDNYVASRNSAQASLKSSEASIAVARANLDKAKAELDRNRELHDQKLVSDSVFQDYQTSFEVASSQLLASLQQTEMARASVTRAEEDLLKTTIVAPIDGTVTKLKSQKGERVVGTAMMAGT
jgi:HlyD family secretion protein